MVVAASRALKERIAEKLSVLAPQLGFLRAIRDVLPDDGVLIDELTQVGYTARSAYEARKALQRGLHVLLFSDNVSLEDEASLLMRPLGRMISRLDALTQPRPPGGCACEFRR